MILSDRDIRKYCDSKDIIIVPWKDENLQPASVDLTLAKFFTVFKPQKGIIDPREDVSQLMEMKVEGTEFVMQPGQFVLASTQEHIEVPDFLVGRLEGKSSLGRIGLIVHATAGYIDPGWKGKITLELSNLSPFPIILRPKMKIAQISFVELSSRVEYQYGQRGNKYQGQELPTPSRSYLDFLSEDELGV